MWKKIDNDNIPERVKNILEHKNLDISDLEVCSDLEGYGYYLGTLKMIDIETSSIFNMKGEFIITRYYRSRSDKAGTQEFYRVKK